MKLSAIIKLSCTAVLFSSLLFAQSGTRTPGIDKRERVQQRRIVNGVKTGQLTKREAVKLERKEAKLKVNEARAKSDGVVTPRERARLKHQENKISRSIYREKHDKQVRR